MRISRYKLNDEVYEKLFVLLFEVLGNRHNKDDFQKSIKDLLSPVERIMIAKRVVIIYLLMQEIDYKIVCKVVKVSAATVNKFRHVMENSEGIVPVLQRILKVEKIQLFLKELQDVLSPPGTAYTSWAGAWERRRQISRKKFTGI